MSMRWKKAPWGLIGMFALVILAERALPRFEIDYMLPQHWDWRQAAKASTAPEVVRSEVLCFGDSLMKQCVQPIVIEAKTGRPTYNLAVSMGQPSASYFLLRRALRRREAEVDRVRCRAVRPFVAPRRPEHDAAVARVAERRGTSRSGGSTGSVAMYLRLTSARLWPTLRAARRPPRHGRRVGVGRRRRRETPVPDGSVSA